MNIVNKILRIPKEFESTDNKEIYKPFSYPFWSSFLFLLPAIYAYINKQYKISIGSALVFIASILNHGTYNKTLNMLDKIIAISCICYFGIYNASWNIYYLLSLIIVIITLIEFSYFRVAFHPTHGLKYHSIIHIMTTMAILLLIESKI